MAFGQEGENDITDLLQKMWGASVAPDWLNNFLTECLPEWTKLLKELLYRGYGWVSKQLEKGNRKCYYEDNKEVIKAAESAGSKLKDCYGTC